MPTVMDNNTLLKKSREQYTEILARACEEQKRFKNTYFELIYQIFQGKPLKRPLDCLDSLD